MTISTLVLGGKQTPIDTTGLWETYQRMVARSTKESDRLQRELAIAGDGAVVNALEMFKLPEAYTADRWPTVALAPYKSSKIRFTYQEHGRTGFHVSDSAREKMDLLVTPPPAPEYSEEERQAEYQRWMATASVGLWFGTVTRGKGDHSGSVKVPFIPKDVMPKSGFWGDIRSGNYWVMFDSPVWQPEALPMDPYLLERLDDSRFRVLAHWDLTPKERQLMALIRE